MSRFKLERALRATTLGLGIALATIATAVPFTVRAQSIDLGDLEQRAYTGAKLKELLDAANSGNYAGLDPIDQAIAFVVKRKLAASTGTVSSIDLNTAGQVHVKTSSGEYFVNGDAIKGYIQTVGALDKFVEPVTLNFTPSTLQQIPVGNYGFLMFDPTTGTFTFVPHAGMSINPNDPDFINALKLALPSGYTLNPVGNSYMIVGPNGQTMTLQMPQSILNNGGGTYDPNAANGGNITINGGSGFPNNNNGGQMVINGGGGNSFPNNGGNIILSGGGSPNQSVFTSGVNQAGGPHMVIGYQLTGVKDMPQFFLGDADEVKDEFILNKGEMKKFSDGGITYAIANVKTSNGIFGAFDWDKWVLLVEKDGKYYLPRQHSELEVPPMLTFLEKRLKADKSDASAKTFLSELHKRKIWGVMPWVKDSADTADNFWAVRNSKAMVDREAAKKALDVGINYQNIQEYHFANGNPQVLISSANSGQMVYGPGSSMMNPSQSTVNLQQIFGNIPGYSFQNGQLVQMNNPMTMGGYSGSIQVSGSPASSSSILQSWLPKPEVVDMGSVQKLRVGRVEKDEIVFDYYIVKDNVAYDKDGKAVYQLDNGIWAVVKGGESKVQVAAEKAEKVPAEKSETIPTAEASLNLVANFSDGHSEVTAVAEGTDSEVREIHDEAERRLEGIATDLRILKAPKQASK